MSKSKTLILIGLFFLWYGLSCTNPEQCASGDDAKVQPINPNGDSELALLMRAMFDEAMEMKKQLAAGQPVKATLDYEKILTAHATEPQKANSPEYKAFAAHYLQTMKALETAAPAHAIGLFDNLVESCMTCHQAMCPGPMVRIKKLRQ